MEKNNKKKAYIYRGDCFHIYIVYIIKCAFFVTQNKFFQRKLPFAQFCGHIALFAASNLLGWRRLCEGLKWFLFHYISVEKQLFNILGKSFVKRLRTNNPLTPQQNLKNLEINFN